VAVWNDLKTRVRFPLARAMHVSDWLQAYAVRYLQEQDRTDLVVGRLVRCPVCAGLVRPVNGHPVESFDRRGVHPACLAPVGSDDVTVPGGIRFSCPECQGIWETFLKS
jgi:hypothetical protein